MNAAQVRCMPLRVLTACVICTPSEAGSVSWQLTFFGASGSERTALPPRPPTLLVDDQRRGKCQWPLRGPTATQHRLHARHHLPRAERCLGDVVIGAQFKAGEAVRFVGPSSIAWSQPPDKAPRPWPAPFGADPARAIGSQPIRPPRRARALEQSSDYIAQFSGGEPTIHRVVAPRRFAVAANADVQLLRG